MTIGFGPPLDIGIDLNGTLDTCHNVVCVRYNLEYGTSITPADITDWDMDHKYPGISRMFYDAGIIYQSKPATGAIATTKLLALQGHRLYLVTGTVRYYEARMWMKHYFPHINKYIFCSVEDKWLLKGLDVRIGDSLMDMSKCGLSLLIDQPWNKNVDGFTRVNNWWEVPAYVSGYKRVTTG